MSRDTYQLDVARHGGAHVDRYNRRGMNVGRYHLNKTPIKHCGKLPPPVPLSDHEKFETAVAGRPPRQ